ncbi:uncharacterized protein LOC129918169 isoform X2 [Episyrphus balteatus]|uniref:uncharacterized protein LOC129918169 isoform X2 n=1 Tax=Episyrphus balteatus TaxID=286459 RepID=UPI0024856CCC|nr:uncharacterized protein LOC129918169 isoform X2 [Episyrphus balteatus]
MTIKPVGSQKSADGGKKDSHGHVQVVGGGEAPNQNVVRSTHRNVVIDSHAAQSPQRRGDVFEEISRHRRSPHKSSGRSKREHHKREREKITTTVQKCISPHHQACVPAIGNKTPTEQQQSPLASASCQAQAPVDISTASLIKAVEEAYSGYNSGDEHLRNKEDIITPDEWKLRDEQFDKLMSEQGFILQNIEEDGACLFRAISLQIYGDEEMHDQIRQQTMDYLYKNREYYSQFLTEDVNSYIKRKRKKDSHGNHIEIQLMSELYNRPIELYCYKSMPINIFNAEQQNNGYPPLRLAYQRGSHYNAIIDPFNATVGVGLGLAGYKPELQTKDAMVLSEQLEIEQTMFEDKLKTTDWEATNEAIEEQIARESYLQWCRENMQQKANTSESETTSSSSSSNYASGSGNAAAASTAATTTATVTSAEAAVASPSKYHQHQLRSSTCTVTNDSLNSSTSSTTSSVGSVPPVPAPSPTSPENSTAITPAALSALNVGNLSPKSLTAFAQSLRKDSELCFDSDDTDMSSTSSHDHPSSDKSSNRGKKSKNRGANSRLSKRRRREIGGNAGNDVTEEKDNDENEKLTTPKQQKATATFCDSGETNKRSRPTTPITCSLFFTDNTNNQQQKPEDKPSSASPTPSSSSSTSSFSSPGTSKQVPNNDAAFFSTSSSPPAPLTPPATSTEKPVSTFYQSLLESSYIADGFAQLSESEMLQQAIQLSTQEYLEDQKRKGGFLF